MSNLRVQEQAELLVDWCVDVQSGDMVTILASEPAKELVTALHAEIGKRGAEPVTVYATLETTIGLTGEHIAALLANREGEPQTPRHLEALLDETDVFIGIRSDTNTNALSGVPTEVKSERAKAIAPVMQKLMGMERVVATAHPTNAWAQRAGMSLPEYEDFVYGAMLRDWDTLEAELEKLRTRLDAADEARITGPKTDLSMRLDGMHAIDDIGELNFPPGEVFTAPVVNSVEGEISFDKPAIMQGQEVEGIRLVFEDGVVTEFTAEKNESTLASVLGTDEGSNRVGEFGIGMNDGIDRFTKNIMFDEKMGGTVHLALGRAYEETVGESREQNQSAIHFDFIKEMDECRLELDGEVHLRR